MWNILFITVNNDVRMTLPPCQEHIRSIWIWIPHWHLEACEWDMMWGWPRLQSRSRWTGCRRPGGTAPSRWVATSPAARVIILRESLDKKVGSFGNWESEIFRNFYNTGCPAILKPHELWASQNHQKCPFWDKIMSQGSFSAFWGQILQKFK